MSYNIRVNSLILEIPASQTFALNSLVLDIKNVMKRGVTSSNSFTVRLTSINMEALGFPTPINTTSISYTRLFPAEVMLGKNVLSTGSIRIKNVDIDKSDMMLQFQDEARTFYDDLDRQANDIDFSAFDLPFTAATFSAIPNITAGQIWAYKNLQCAINGDETDIDVFTRPCYSVRELLKEFIASVGFTSDFATIGGSITEIDKLLLTSHADKFIVSDFRQNYINAAFTDQAVNIDTNDFTAQTTTFVGNKINNPSFKISLNLKGTVTSEFGASIKISNIGGDEFITINPGRNFINFTTDQYDISTDTDISIIGSLIFENVFLYVVIDEKNIADEIGKWEIDATNTSILTDYTFLGAHNLPDMTQLDLFRIFWSLYFVKIDIDVFQKKIGFRLFGQESELSAIDVTDDLVGEGKISPNKLFARQNTFGYSNDQDTFMGYASFIFRTGTDIDTPIQDYIRFPFAGSINKEGATLPSFARVEVYSRSDNFNASDTESRIELTNRLLLEISSEAVFNSLNWNFLFDKYYNPLFGRITGKRLNVRMYMTYERFKDLSDLGFVFIRNKGIFFVENIRAFRVGKPINVSLLFLT